MMLRVRQPVLYTASTTITGALSKTFDNVILSGIGAPAIIGTTDKVLGTLIVTSNDVTPVPSQIYQEIWIYDKREKGEPRKNRRVVKKIKRQIQEAVQAVEAIKEVQKRQESFAQQKEAIDLAQRQIERSFELLSLETQKLELPKAAEAYQAKVRLEEYVRQEYEKAVILYQEGLKRKEQEELEDLQMLLDYLMAEG